MAQVQQPDVPVTDERDDYFVRVPEWVVLAGLTPTALALYTVLLGHVKRKRGDDLAWPSMDLLADVLGFGKRQSVIRYLNELVDRGIIEVETTKCATGRRNSYTVHRHPPEVYSGARSFTEFHRARREARGGLSPTGDHGASATEDNGSSPTGDKNQTKATRRTDPYESTSGNEVASSDPRTSSPTRFEDQSERPKLLILLGQDYDGLPESQIPQRLIAASVSAARTIDIELSADAKTDLGRAIKTQHEYGVERRELARRVEVTLNLAAAGKTDFAWAFGYPRAA